MKIYIAGKLRNESERERLEKIDSLCKELGFSTFLPHRDAGLGENINDTQIIFKKDIIDGFRDVKLIIADLDGLHVGAGTAWEMGYGYAKGIPIIGLKTDEKFEDSLEYLSHIILGSIIRCSSFSDLKNKLKDIKSR